MQEKKDKKDLGELLNPGNGGLVHESRNTLARFWRTILADRQVSLIKWSGYMERYLSDPRNGVRQDSKSRSSARGNLNKELLKAWISWKVFEKGLRFLGPVQAEISVKFIWDKTADKPYREETIHKLTLDLNEMLDDDDPEREE